MSRNSDRRKIKDIQNITGQYALEKITALETVSFKHVDEDQEKPATIGFIAQDFAKVFPELIKKRKKDNGRDPIKDPVFEKPKPKPTPPDRIPGRVGLLAEGDPIDPPVDPENPNPPVDPEKPPEEPVPEPMPEEPAFEPDPISEPVGGFTILSYEELIPLMVGSIKELKNQVEKLKSRIEKLEQPTA